MNGQRDIITRKQVQAIAALLTCNTLEEAATMLGLSARTLYRWLKDPDFAEAYLEARREMMRQGTALLSRTMRDGVQTLRELSADPNCPAGARVMAARALVDRAFRAHEMEDLSVRMARLEQQLQEENV